MFGYSSCGSCVVHLVRVGVSWWLGGALYGLCAFNEFVVHSSVVKALTTFEAFVKDLILPNN